MKPKQSGIGDVACVEATRVAPISFFMCLVECGCNKKKEQHLFDRNCQFSAHKDGVGYRAFFMGGMGWRL